MDQEAQQAEQRRKLELDYARELPEIRRLLHPFISDGRVQPIPGGFQSGWRMEPMSLSAIASTGALRDTDDGLAELYRVGGHSLNARRGLGGFPSHNPINLARNPSVRKTVERARELLQKYGDLLVEKGVLSRLSLIHI